MHPVVNNKHEDKLIFLKWLVVNTLSLDEYRQAMGSRETKHFSNTLVKPCFHVALRLMDNNLGLVCYKIKKLIMVLQLCHVKGYVCLTVKEQSSPSRVRVRSTSTHHPDQAGAALGYRHAVFKNRLVLSWDHLATADKKKQHLSITWQKILPGNLWAFYYSV